LGYAQERRIKKHEHSVWVIPWEEQNRNNKKGKMKNKSANRCIKPVNPNPSW